MISDDVRKMLDELSWADVSEYLFGDLGLKAIEKGFVLLAVNKQDAKDNLASQLINTVASFNNIFLTVIDDEEAAKQIISQLMAALKTFLDGSGLASCVFLEEGLGVVILAEDVKWFPVFID